MQKGFKKLKLKIGRDRTRTAKTTEKSNIQNQRAEKEDFKFTTKILNTEFSFLTQNKAKFLLPLYSFSITDKAAFIQYHSVKSQLKAILCKSIKALDDNFVQCYLGVLILLHTRVVNNGVNAIVLRGSSFY